MRVIFCDSGFSSKAVDYMYAEEYKSARQNFISTSLISFEELKRENLKSALKYVSINEEEELGIYRGWMMKPTQYELFYELLLEKNIKLINNPQEYKFCHYLPESYELIKKYTPKTTFKKLIGDFDIENFREQIEVFGDNPIVIKDYVKSQKHYWEEACYIPKASDFEKSNTIINKFLELQDLDLNEGLVFREFIELEELANHSESGMPLTKEFRVFVKNAKIVSVFKYWDEGDYENVEPTLTQFKEVITRIKSNFFTMDIAKKKDGDWIIVELGDGQVAGLPDNANKGQFYTELKNN